MARRPTILDVSIACALPDEEFCVGANASPQIAIQKLNGLRVVANQGEDAALLAIRVIEDIAGPGRWNWGCLAMSNAACC
jgi:hypothetical protein